MDMTIALQDPKKKKKKKHSKAGLPRLYDYHYAVATATACDVVNIANILQASGTPSWQLFF